MRRCLVSDLILASRRICALVFLTSMRGGLGGGRVSDRFGGGGAGLAAAPGVMCEFRISFPSVARLSPPAAALRVVRRGVPTPDFTCGGLELDRRPLGAEPSRVAALRVVFGASELDGRVFISGQELVRCGGGVVVVAVASESTCVLTWWRLLPNSAKDALRAAIRARDCAAREAGSSESESLTRGTLDQLTFGVTLRATMREGEAAVRGRRRG